MENSSSNGNTRIARIFRQIHSSGYRTGPCYDSRKGRSMKKGWLFALALAASATWAQEFPVPPVKIVVPWPASGNVDITARTVAPALSDALGQQVIVENRAGAAGRI